MNDNPKVSVCVSTYNQVGFIKQCLSSIISQDVGFEFEIIISDDCSIDGTREIVEAFKAEFPGVSN